MKIIKVTPQNIDNFNKQLNTPNVIAFVKIYSDQCGHCKDLKPKWNKLEDEMKNESMEGLLASISVNDLDDAECDTETKGVPTLRVYEGGKRIMDYEGKRETNDMKYFLKNLLKKQKGGKRKTKKRRRKTKKKKRTKKRRRRGGQICFTKKCKKDRERKKTDKLNKQFSKDSENLRYNLAWEVCSDKTTKNEYDQCVNSVVGKQQSTDEFINSIQLNKNTTNSLKKNIGPAPGMRKRTSEVSYVNPMHQQAGKRKRKTRRKKQKRKTRRKK
tara:strand:- start:1154 stop:1966 length:813 start_codon:yes stop_codon:yes gene_type:complete